MVVVNAERWGGSQIPKCSLWESMRNVGMILAVPSMLHEAVQRKSRHWKSPLISIYDTLITKAEEDQYSNIQQTHTQTICQATKKMELAGRVASRTIELEGAPAQREVLSNRVWVSNGATKTWADCEWEERINLIAMRVLRVQNS